MIFTLEESQKSKLSAWLKEKETALAWEQLKNYETADKVIQCGKQLIPFLGASGGSVTYEFTPTSIGTITKVVWCAGMPFEDTIDLTDYDFW